jgi:hypothetical protein
MRQRECGVAIADTGEVRREISQALGDEMHDFALALDAAAHGEHAG